MMMMMRERDEKGREEDDEGHIEMPAWIGAAIIGAATSIHYN